MSTWDRREFLKAGAVGGTGLALTNERRLLRTVDKPFNAHIARSLHKFRNPAPTVCRMCPAHCGMVAYRDGDRVVQLRGSPGSPTNQGGLCSRAFAGLERAYDPERQLHPLRREGPRGSGRWQPISWEAALAEIRSRLGGFGGASVLHLAEEETLVQDLRPTLGWDRVLADRTLPGRAAPGAGQSWYGAPVLAADVARARAIYLFGLRPFDGEFPVPMARDLVEALRSGSRVELFDCFAGHSSTLARWQAVAPGSEAHVAYGIARYLMEWGVHDAEALSLQVTDTTEALQKSLARFTPEAVEQASGLSPLSLLALAKAFASERPALALAPAGSPQAPAAALLNHLVGAINTPGGIATARGPFFGPELEVDAAVEAWFEALVEGRFRARLYWSVGANPAYQAPDSERVRAALADPERVAFAVAMDTHLTETATLADLFLPLATHLESWNYVEGCLPDGRTYLSLQQPVTRPASEPEKLKDPTTEQLHLFEPLARPLGEARGLGDVLLDLARAAAPEATPYASTHAYLDETLRKSWGPGSLQALRERGTWVSEEGRPPNPTYPVRFTEAIDATATPDPEAEQPPPGVTHLVRFWPPVLASRYANSRLGREIVHRSQALLHPDAAKRLGLRDGDRVTVTTAVGTARLPVRLVEGIHPRAVALLDAMGHTASGSVARNAPAPPIPEPEQVLVKRKDFLTNPLGQALPKVAPAEPIWWTEADPGSSVRALYPFRIAADGVQDWGALEVEVRKA